MHNKLRKIEEHFLVLTLVAMVILIFWQILGRFIFQSAPSWTEEVARYIHIFQVWIGASYSVKLGEHIRVGVFVELLHGKARKIAEMTGTIIWFLFSIFLGIFGTQLVFSSFNFGQVSPAVEIPFWILFLAIPLGGFGMAYRLIHQIIKIKNTDYPKKEKGVNV